MRVPAASPAAPPPKPRADVARAPWDALPLPICPRLLAPETREHMAALALFARALREAVEASEEKDARIGRVETLELALSGAFGPALSRPELLPAVILRDSLLATGGSFADMLALADAAKDEIAGVIPSDGRAPLDHAARTVAPVLRHLLHLHGNRDDSLLARADELARAWFFLRRDGADSARLAEAMLRRAGDLAASVSDGHLKAQLYRLQALARAALATKSTDVAALSAFTRLRVRLVAWLKLWTG